MKIVAVVTDNAPNMTGGASSSCSSSASASSTDEAGMLSYPCQAHTLNLLAGDICKVSHASIHARVVAVLKTFRNTHALAAGLSASPSSSDQVVQRP